MKKTTTVLVLLALLALPIAYAISTTTQVHFVIASVVAYTLTLPGESLVDANSTGAPTTDIEFTSATGTDPDVEAKVVSGDWQNSTTPIFQFDNTGTVDLNISVVLDADPASCINFTGATTHGAAGTVISTSNISVVNGFGPSDPAQDWFMKADFTGCVQGDSSVETLTSYGVQS